MAQAIGKWSYTKGLHDLSNGCYAYLQPDGGWGWSNAGLVVHGGESMLVDTLFDFEGIDVSMPTLTFEGEMVRRVGNKTVCLIQVGPAHTRGDVLACVPDDRVIFTGDILFIHGHPIIWVGPVGNWIKACQLML